MKSRVSSRLARWITALAMVLGGVFAFAPAANASDPCPLYPNPLYDTSTRSIADSYGTWWTDDNAPLFAIKQGNTTCGTHVYSVNTLGPIDVYVYERVWYLTPQGVAQSHTPVLVHQFSSVNQYDGVLHDMGTVPTGDRYQIQILQFSRTVGVASAQCSSSHPCFMTWRG